MESQKPKARLTMFVNLVFSGITLILVTLISELEIKFAVCYFAMTMICVYNCICYARRIIFKEEKKDSVCKNQK